jgi:hypothetical protein
MGGLLVRSTKDPTLGPARSWAFPPGAVLADRRSVLVVRRSRSSVGAFVLAIAVGGPVAGACSADRRAAGPSPSASTPASTTEAVVTTTGPATRPPRTRSGTVPERSLADVCGSTVDCPQPDLPGYEVTGVPAGWTRTLVYMGTGYMVQYQQPVPEADRAAAVEALGRRISLVVTADPDGTAPIASGYPGRPATVAGVPATVVETGPPPGGRHGVAWRAGSLVFELFAYLDEPALLDLAATVAPTGQRVQR